MTDAERLVLVLCADLLLAADGHDRKANVMQMRERLRQARHDLDSEAIANAATLAAVGLLVDAIHVGALKPEPCEATIRRAKEALGS